MKGEGASSCVAARFQRFSDKEKHTCQLRITAASHRLKDCM
jgi:hypothetical protein